jgi:hypothetical protein
MAGEQLPVEKPVLNERATTDATWEEPDELIQEESKADVGDLVSQFRMLQEEARSRRSISPPPLKSSPETSPKEHVTSGAVPKDEASVEEEGSISVSALLHQRPHLLSYRVNAAPMPYSYSPFLSLDEELSDLYTEDDIQGLFPLFQEAAVNLSRHYDCENIDDYLELCVDALDSATEDVRQQNTMALLWLCLAGQVNVSSASSDSPESFGAASCLDVNWERQRKVIDKLRSIGATSILVSHYYACAQHATSVQMAQEQIGLPALSCDIAHVNALSLLFIYLSHLYLDNSKEKEGRYQGEAGKEVEHPAVLQEDLGQDKAAQLLLFLLQQLIECSEKYDSVDNTNGETPPAGEGEGEEGEEEAKQTNDNHVGASRAIPVRRTLLLLSLIMRAELCPKQLQTHHSMRATPKNPKKTTAVYKDPATTGAVERIQSARRMSGGSKCIPTDLSGNVDEKAREKNPDSAEAAVNTEAVNDVETFIYNTRLLPESVLVSDFQVHKPRMLRRAKTLTEHFFRVLIGEDAFQPAVIAMLRVLLAVSPTKKAYVGSVHHLGEFGLVDAYLGMDGMAFAKSVLDSHFEKHVVTPCDSILIKHPGLFMHTQSIMRSCSFVLLSLLKAFRSNHVTQFCYLKHTLLSYNAALLLLKVLNLKIRDWLEFPLGLAYLSLAAVSETPSHGDHSLIYWRDYPEFSPRAMQTIINVTRIFNKLVRYDPMVISDAVDMKAHIIFKRLFLAAAAPDLDYYVLKVSRFFLKGLNRKWKASNSSLLSCIFLGLPPEYDLGWFALSSTPVIPTSVKQACSSILSRWLEKNYLKWYEFKDEKRKWVYTADSFLPFDEIGWLFHSAELSSPAQPSEDIH